MFVKNLSSFEQTTLTIPKSPGVYILHTHLLHPQTLLIGGLGEFNFQPGDYLYVGSALGPGGLKARLGRHLRGNGRCHWHIDWLRQVTDVIGYFYLETTDHMECQWSQHLINMPRASVPAPGFGASDCRSKGESCFAHLVWFQSGVNVTSLRKHLSAEHGSQVEYRNFTS